MKSNNSYNPYSTPAHCYKLFAFHQRQQSYTCTVGCEIIGGFFYIQDEPLVSISSVSDIAELSEPEQDDTTSENYATVTV